MTWYSKRTGSRQSSHRYDWQDEERQEAIRRGQKKLLKAELEHGPLEPVDQLQSRLKIATSFWGRAWCQHLESLGDYENRLPRGRTYVRNGSVKHLHIGPGTITALVQGSDLYEQTIHINTLPAEKWQRLRSRCQGRIGSLIELLQGRISDEILAVVTDREEGLFPLSGEIRFNCSCPDWASMCKHIAAILYGVGARLDRQPELLFTLRGVDQQELLTTVTEPLAQGVDGSASIAGTGGSKRRRLAGVNLASVFGEEIAVVSEEGAVVPALEPPAKPEPLPEVKPRVRNISPKTAKTAKTAAKRVPKEGKKGRKTVSKKTPKKSPKKSPRVKPGKSSEGG